MENKQFKLEGVDDIQIALNRLPEKLQARIYKNFLTKAGKKFVVEPLKAELNYSKETEKTIKVIGVPGNQLAVAAGVTSAGYKLRWADLGTKERTKGHYRGKIEGQKEIQPFLEDQAEPIVKYAEEELANEIDLTLQKMLKKLKKA